METSTAFVSWLGKTIEQSLSDTGVFRALKEIDSTIDELKTCTHELAITKCGERGNDIACVRSVNGK
jgi:hypothetical protein